MTRAGSARAGMRLSWQGVVASVALALAAMVTGAATSSGWCREDSSQLVVP